MLPFSAGIPARRFPIVNVLLIAANFAVFILCELPQLHTAVYHAAFYPCTVDNACHGPEPWGLSWITAMFLHGGWGHIMGNMLFLAIFGKNIEDAFGPLRYLVFYFAAMMTQTAMTLLFGTAAEARVPELGASGAIAAGWAPTSCSTPPLGPAPTFPRLPGQHPSLDLPWAVVLVPAHRGELRFVQRLGERGGVAFFAHVGGLIFGLLAAQLLAQAGQTAPGEQWRPRRNAAESSPRRNPRSRRPVAEMRIGVGSAIVSLGINYQQ